MKIRVLIAALVLAGAAASPAFACSLAPDYDRHRVAYYRSVTSVFIAVAEDFRATDPRYPTDQFTVRLKPVETVWGAPHTQPLTLEFTPGACNEWFLWNDDTKLDQIKGSRYFVFLAPDGERNPSLIRVEPASGLTGVEAMVLLGRLQITGGRPPSADDPVGPQWPPASVAKQPGPELPHWLPWLGGASVISLFIGFLIGRGRAARTKKSKTS